ncbi:MAG: amino acid adenylation domain-containing protein [Dinghuibacter sp.]|nr:amino acid adenylation domain-containing protein [Dinghuibacter sp.]
MVFQQELNKHLHKHAQRTAIEFGAQKMSYAELAGRAAAVTHSLLTAQLPAGSNIVLFLTSVPDMVAAIIGTVNAGMVFVPADPQWPSARLESLMMLTEPAALVTDNALLPLAQALTQNKPCTVVHIQQLPALPPLATSPVATHEDDSIYIYFTSGSTGVPKGIIGRNASLLQFIQWELSAFPINEADRFSQFISPYFDAFLRDVFVPLFAGAVICVPESGKETMVSSQLPGWLNEQQISIVHCVPSVFRLFNTSTLTAADYPNLEYVLMSGEKINPAELAGWYQVFGERVQLVNLYGATETTMIRSYYLVKPADVQASRIPIGSPINDTQLLVLNRDRKPCGPLVPGDLYIVSDYITKGYLKNPELNEQRFVHVLLNGQPHRAFNTGDKARLLPDGSIDLIGRDDRQVKIQGVRVELDEVEQVLMQSGRVKNAVVLLQANAKEPEKLLAFVQAKENNPVAELGTYLLQYVREYLPAYAVPAQITLLESFPLLPNGKINYRELLNRAVNTTILPPANETETRLLAIWKEILGDKPISTDASFHLMGGNSISIMRLIGRIYKDFNVRISLAEIFDKLTIQDQAALIRSSTRDHLYVIHPAPEKPFYNLSSVQERIYYNYAVNKNRTSYNLPMAWTITGDYNEEKITHVFRQLVQRHESLRTRFTDHNGTILQEVLNEVTFVPEIIEAADQNVYSAVLAFCRPFDLSVAPLFRAGIIKTPSGSRVMAVDFHHIICDGFSQMILLSDFSKLYNNEPLAPLPIQYKDFAEWEYQFRLTEEYTRNREFWLRSFEGDIPRLAIPTTDIVHDDTTDKGGNFEFFIPRRAVEPLLNMARGEAITHSSVFLAVYLVFLSQLTGQQDLVTGVASSGRMQQEIEEVVGMFVKTLPIRYRLNLDQTVRELVGSVHHSMVQANSKQLYDLSDIVGELNVSRLVPVKSLFDVQFVFLNFSGKKKTEGVYDFAEYEFENPNSKSALILYIREDEEEFYARMEYARAYFTRADVEMLATQFQTLAQQLALRLNDQLAPIVGTDTPAAPVVTDDISFNF